MDRRRFLLTSLAGVLAVPLAAEAQQAGRVYRVGYLSGWSRQTHDDELERALGRLGWILGENLFVEYRWTEGQYERFAPLAVELVRLKPHVVVAPQTAAALAAQKATLSIPIVMVFIAEPVGLGLVQSLARPGGNITGTTLWGGWEIFAKQLQLLREVAPGVSRVAVLYNPANRPAHPLVLKSVDAAARSMQIDLHPQGVRTREEFEAAFAAIVRAGAGALLEISDVLFITHRARLADLAIRSRLPTMFGLRQSVEAGGLMHYGSTSAEMLQRAATIVDKILKGADPAVLPVEEPTKYELVINLKTAKALGLTIPPSLLARADQIIE
jgi:putative tryptophan/tyrosine transport system substrate-binding protein